MTFEPIDWNDDDDQPAPQQMADGLPERYNLGRSCGVTATLIAAADMTTDEIAADVRVRMAANPTHAAALQDVADRLVRTIRDRLPYIEPADAGAVMVNLGAYITHALELFIGYGMDPATAGQSVANVIAIAGQQLYGQTTKETTR